MRSLFTEISVDKSENLINALRLSRKTYTAWTLLPETNLKLPYRAGVTANALNSKHTLALEESSDSRHRFRAHFGEGNSACGIHGKYIMVSPRLMSVSTPAPEYQLYVTSQWAEGFSEKSRVRCVWNMTRFNPRPVTPQHRWHPSHALTESRVSKPAGGQEQGH